MKGSVWKVLEPRNLELGPAKDIESDRWKNWRMALDEGGIAWLVIDKAGSSANTLSEEVLREFDEILADLETTKPKGLVIRSGKPDNFIVGADVKMFQGMQDAAAVEEKVKEAHSVVDRLEALPFTTLTIAHGNCVGGGLEIALACDHRIAIAGAKLGFPEILLGLHPGLGGTARSTHLIDPTEAMKMMLTGKSVDARKAKSLGLVDAVTEERHVRNAVRATMSGDLKTRDRGIKAAAMSSYPARVIAARQMRHQAADKAPPKHYPAPNALIALWEEHGGSLADMKCAEQASFARLVVSETAQNLIRVFFLRSGLKAKAGDESEVRHVHVVGAGAMGGDIAAWCALQGIRVTLADLDAEALGKAVGRANTLYGKILKDGAKVRDALDRLIPDLAGAGAARADIVIEAVPERTDLKQKVYAGLEAKMKPGAILATNTSSIRLEDLAKGLKRPERFVGLHFFNPVSRMQLIEVVRHPELDQDVLARATAFAGQIDRLPVPVKSSPGFLVNRALTPYLVEAIAMVDEGIAKETIDRAAEDFGMPMGPIELADQVGLDICVEVAAMLRADLDPSMPEIPEWLKDKVEQGKLGRKTGEGLYRWKGDEPVKPEKGAEPSREMTDRLILPMLNACAACLREGVVADADTLDGAMIFGTGFAPFRGGPMHYARTRGVDDIVSTLRSLEQAHGARFKPDEGWQSVESRQQADSDLREAV
ncbi:3-hydroxyacyl-CoA dehydrogenase NAD-binding domain-containing protein [Microbaculum marinum]|uniref:enoyl-CoA hydratase n=1 Tax=Microbaculum marinum TaxID=1764581 RepID=A0AAW9RGN9_9HYPH